ncbi:MAG TPA: thermostable hemolysin [Croceibacterium sp.]|nr:thermostable hemolysin [Croceibacterium sp.]
MPPIDGTSLVRRTYQDKFGASISPAFTRYLSQGGERAQAVLGFRRAGDGPLFLEAYLDRPIQLEVEQAFGRPIARDAIVEIGNFAATNAMAMVELWGAAANDLGNRNEVAVATLTAQLRHAFSRIGIPIAVIAAAEPHRLGEASRTWGRYYQADPRVCAGIIAQGQEAIGAFLARRASRKVA